MKTNQATEAPDQQTIEYNTACHKFEADNLKTLELEDEVQTDLKELFSRLSQSKMYSKLSNRIPVISLLLIMAVLFGFLILFLTIGLVAKPGAIDPALPPEVFEWQSANATAPDNEKLNTTLTGNTTNNSTNPVKQNNIGNYSDQTPNLYSEAPQTTSSQPNRLLLVNFDARDLQVKDSYKSEFENEKDLASQSETTGFAGEMTASLVLTAILFGISALALLFFELRKRRLLIQLKTFESTELTPFLERNHGKLEIETLHEREQIFKVFKCFNIFSFKFIVKRINNGADTLVDKPDTFEQRESFFSKAERQSWGEDTMDLDPEKHNSVILTLNKKLDRLKHS